MTTALIHSPYVSILSIPPLAPALLKSCLLAEGMDAVTFDFNQQFHTEFEADSKIKILAWMTTPDIKIDVQDFQRYQNFVRACVAQVLTRSVTSIGISVFSHESQRFVEDFCYWTKIAQPDIYISVGGGGVNIHQNLYGKIWGDLMLESHLADSVLVGEGERMVAGIFKTKPQGLLKTPQMDNDELADLPVPNFDDYDLDAYGPREALRLPITASKGCVRSCSFCDVANIWPRYRYRRGENVANEMISIYQRYGIRNFAFTDSLINGGLKPFREMNAILSEQLPDTIRYSGQFICRSSRDMPEKDFYLMKKGGCSRVSIGIESGSESVRSHMKKQFSDLDIEYTVEQLLINNIAQTWNIIVGYPTETDQDWQATLDLILKYQAHKDLIKISPIGVFQLLQNTPMSQPSMLSDLDIETHIVNGYSEYGWVSRKNPSNTLRSRGNRWKELVSLLKKLDMLNPGLNIDQKTMVIEQQVEYYEKQSDKPMFTIYQQSYQNPTTLDCQ